MKYVCALIFEHDFIYGIYYIKMNDTTLPINWFLLFINVKIRNQTAPRNNKIICLKLYNKCVYIYHVVFLFIYIHTTSHTHTVYSATKETY